MNFILCFLILINFFNAAGYTYEIAVCAMFQNEAPYFKEWLEFHRLIGVEHFYLYNNASTDDYNTVLLPYCHAGLVTIINWPYIATSNWDSIQQDAYNHALASVQDQVHWLAFIDLDEFIMPLEHSTLLDLLSEYQEFGGLCIQWRLFGTSHIRRIAPTKLIVESLILRAPTVYDAHYRVKSIVQPNRVVCCKNQHVFEYKQPYYHVLPNKHTFASVPQEICCEKVQINHYWTRDVWYCTRYKLPRRRRYNNGLDILKRAQQLNGIRDTSALRFAPALRAAVFGN